MRVRYATHEDVEAVDKLFAANNDFLGFVMKVQLEESASSGWLLICEDPDSGELLGAVNFRPTKRGYLTIYEIAAQYKGRRIGDVLIDELKRSGLDIRLKVTEDNLGAIKFYKRNGFEHIVTEHGRKRKLLVMHFKNSRQSRLF